MVSLRFREWRMRTSSTSKRSGLGDFTASGFRPSGWTSRLAGLCWPRAVFAYTAFRGSRPSTTIDVVEHPPERLPYSALKQSLLDSHQLSDYQRVTALHKMEPLGGRKPSELLASMLELCPRGHETSIFFTHLFLERLPAELRITLGRGRPSECQGFGQEGGCSVVSTRDEDQLLGLGGGPGGPGRACGSGSGVLARLGAWRPRAWRPWWFLRRGERG